MQNVSITKLQTMLPDFTKLQTMPPDLGVFDIGLVILLYDEVAMHHNVRSKRYVLIRIAIK